MHLSTLSKAEDSTTNHGEPDSERSRFACWTPSPAFDPRQSNRRAIPRLALPQRASAWNAGCEKVLSCLERGLREGHEDSFESLCLPREVARGPPRRQGCSLGIRLAEMLVEGLIVSARSHTEHPLCALRARLTVLQRPSNSVCLMWETRTLQGFKADRVIFDVCSTAIPSLLNPRTITKPSWYGICATAGTCL